MLTRQAQVFLAQLGALRALRRLSCCAATDLEAAKPGSVTPHDQHILLQLPRPPGAPPPPGAWWPPLVEKEPAVVAVFQALAEHAGSISGKVKVTACEELSRGEGPPPGTVDLLAFPLGRRWQALPAHLLGLAVALATVDEPDQIKAKKARRLVEGHQAPLPILSLFVCCHGSRDARCGQRGPLLAAALSRLVRERGLGGEVGVFATSHIGGHRYAGNVVCYGPMHPCDGDWFGGLEARHAPGFLSALWGIELGVDGGAEDAALRPFWRGRLGLTKQEQLQLFEQGGGIEEVDAGALDEPAEESDDEGGEEVEAELAQRLRKLRAGLHQARHS